MVISSDFHMGQYRDDGHREDAAHFMRFREVPDSLMINQETDFVFLYHLVGQNRYFLVLKALTSKG